MKMKKVQQSRAKSQTCLLFPLRGPRHPPLLSTMYVPVFRDVEADVDEASDVVCNVGLDIGDIVVEHGEIEEEEGRIARFLAGGCSCKLHDGTPCCTQFTASMLQEARAEC